MQPTTTRNIDKLPEIRARASLDAFQRKNREVANFNGNIPRSETEKLSNNFIRGLSREIKDQDDEETLSNPDTKKHRYSGTQPINREITVGLSYLDMGTRLRELEKKYLDLSSSFDRRIQSFLEENPQKILRMFKTFEEKDTQLWKDNFNKQVALQDSYQTLKDTLKSNIDQLATTVITLTRKVEDNEYKMIQVERGIEALIKERPKPGLLAIENKPSTDKVSPLETEVRLLKEAFQHDQQRKELFFQDMMRQYQEVNHMVQSNENQVLQKIKKYKDEIYEDNRNLKEQQKKLEELKLEKLLSDSDYLRNLIKSCENRLADEIDKRLKHEFENKNWIQQKINSIKEELKNDEMELLDGEKKFIKNMQESVVSLNIIIKNTKEQLEANLASTQAIFNENVKSLTKTMEVMKDTVYTKLNIFDAATKDLTTKLIDTQGQFNEHAKIINNTLEKEFGRVEKVTIKFEEMMLQNIKTQDEKINTVDNGIKNWQKDFEDKNLKILLEVSNALKSIKAEVSKEKGSTDERYTTLRNEFLNMQTANDALFQQTNEHMKTLEKQLEYKYNEILVKFKEDVKNVAFKAGDDLKRMGQLIFDKCLRDIKTNVASLDKKLSTAFQDEIFSLKDLLTNSIKNHHQLSREELKTDKNELIDKINAVDKKHDNANHSLSLEDEENKKALHDYKLEVNGLLNNVSTITDGKIRVLNDNFRRDILANTDQLRQEVNKMLDSEKQFLEQQTNVFRNENTQTLSKLRDQLRQEFIEADKKVNDQVEKALLEEQDIRAKKDTEISSNIQVTKVMLMETIETRIESAQALARALVNEEAAERARGDEAVLKLFKSKTDSMEGFFNQMVESTSQELKLQFEESMKQLMMKFEKHKVWTIHEINSMATEVEDYIKHQTAKEYMNNLFQINEQRILDQNFKEVGALFEEMEEVRDNDLQNLNYRLEYMDRLRMDDMNGMLFKLGLMEKQRYEDMDKLELKLANQQSDVKNDFEEMNKKVTDVDNQRQKDVDGINVKIGEIDQNLANHQETLTKHEELLGSQNGDITQFKKEVDERFITLKTKLIARIDDVNDNVFIVDEKFSVALQDLHYQLESHLIYENLYHAAKEKQDAASTQDSSLRAGNVEEALKHLAQRLTETNDTLQAFEDKTEGNFKIAEMAILSHTSLLNQIDAQIFVMELTNKVVQQNFEEKIAIEIFTLETDINNTGQKIENKLDKRIDGLQKYFEEDVIPGSILRMEEKMNGLQNQVGNQTGEINRSYGSKLSEHEIKLEHLEELIKKQSRRITEDEKELEIAKQDLVFMIESKYYSIELMSIAFERTLKNDIAVSFSDVVQISNSKGVELNGDMEAKMNQALDNTVQKNVKKNMEDLENKVKDLSNKVQELENRPGDNNNGGGGGSNNNNPELQKEIDRLKGLIDDIQKEMKAKDDNLSRKLDSISNNVNGLQNGLKDEIEKSNNSQAANYQNVSSQLDKLLQQLNTISDKIYANNPQ